MSSYSHIENNHYAEVNYDLTPNSSTWGSEENSTTQAIEKIVSGGIWLNLAAGDGRFNHAILTRCEQVVAADNNDKALGKLIRNTPNKFHSKLSTKIFDITKQFPYSNSFFDGCFCTATLHMFDSSVIKLIISEIMRVVKQHGRIILDFRTDIKRRMSNGELYLYPSEAAYNTEEGRALLDGCFADQVYTIVQEKRGPVTTTIGNVNYIFESQCLLLTCKSLNKEDAIANG